MVPSFNREAVHNQKVTKLWTFSVRGWGGWAQPHFIAFVGVFPHNGDSTTTKLPTKQQILAQSNQYNDKTPPKRL